jgi:hypothetical protein
MNAHSKEQLERIFENRDGRGGLMGAFVRPPHPVILGEWIQPASSSELIDVEGVVLGHQGFHYSLVVSTCSLGPGSEIIMRDTFSRSSQDERAIIQFPNHRARFSRCNIGGHPVFVAAR